MPTRAKKLIILAGDVVFLYASLFLTVYIRYSLNPIRYIHGFNSEIFWAHVAAFTPLIFLWLVIFYIHNLYEITSAKNTLEFYSSLSRSLTVNFLVAVLFFYFANFTEVTPKTNLFIYFAIFSTFFVLWRSQINSLLKKSFLVNTVVISSNGDGLKLALKLNQNSQIGYKVSNFIGPVQISPNVVSQNFMPEMADISERIDLDNLVNNNDIRALIIDDKFLNKDIVVDSLVDFVDRLEIINLTKFNERVWRKVDLDSINQLWFLNNLASGKKSFYGSIKRTLDFFISLVLLPIFFILGILIAVLIKIEGDGSVFYQQTRVGRKGKLFNLIKFRTMRTDAEANGVQWTTQNDSRITKVGRFLRKIRLDELPQLINILKGEMSFVGPRAERPEFHQMLVKEIPFYEKRYLVKPGLTGWAQINYTYGSSVEDTKEKLAYDFYYIKNRSFIFDIGIILKTVNIVLSALGR